MKSSIRNIRIVSVLTLSSLSLAACSGSQGDALSQAQSAYDSNAYQDARIYLLNRLQENPNDQAANLLFAKVALSLGDGESARTALGKLPENQEGLRPMQSHAAILRGRARDVVTQYEEIDQSNWLEQDWRMLNWAKLELGMDQQAYESLQTAIKKHPNSSDLLALLGNYYLNKNDLKTALEFAKKALNNDEDNYEALNLAGRCSIRLGDIKQAEIYYDQAAKKYPDNPIPVINLAGLALDRDDLKTAEPYVKRAQQLNSELPFTKFIEARYKHIMGDNQAAKTILQDTKSGLDGFGPAISLMGRVAYELGEYELAADRLKRSLAEDPNNIEDQNLLNQVNAKIE